MTTLLRLFVAGMLLAPMGAAAPAAAATGGEVSLEPCSICHDDLAKSFENNPHLRATLPAGAGAGLTVVCEDCHGNGSKHADSGDPADIKVPKGVAANDVCLTCHANRTHPGVRSDAHFAGNVGCVDCHHIHGGDLLHAQPLLARPVDDLCASCHPVQAASFSKPYAHKLGRDGVMTCVSCHDPHAGRGRRSLKTTATGEGPCLSCHTEKRGPFVFEHVIGVTGGCMSCHEPHGSSNPKRLIRARVDQLCLECHSPISGGTLGSQPPSFHDLRTARYRQCTVCHVAIHGSNTSPMLLK